MDLRKALEALRGQIRSDIQELLANQSEKNLVASQRQEHLLEQLVEQQGRLKHQLMKLRVGGVQMCNPLWAGDVSPLPANFDGAKQEKVEMNGEVDMAPMLLRLHQPAQNGNLVTEEGEQQDEEYDELWKKVLSPFKNIRFPMRFETSSKKKTWLTCLMDGGGLDFIMSFVIILNAVFMGFITEMSIQDAIESFHKGEQRTFEDEQPYVLYGEIVFSATYCAELLLKIFYFRVKFLTGKDAGWNVFDTILVGLTSVSFFIAGGSKFGWLRVVYTFKNIIRALRIVRVVRFFQSMRVIMVSIACSMHSFVWALVTLLLIMYIHSIIFVQGIAAYIRSPDQDPVAMGVAIDHWGSLYRAMQTEYKSITGGSPWGNFVLPLQKAGGLYYFLFLMYIALLSIAVLRLLTGIFVQDANKASAKDFQQTVRQNLKLIFQQVDTDHSGFISKQEFRKCLNDSQTARYLSMMHIHPDDSSKLFELLDSSGDDRVDLEEFISGCQSLSGSARAVDMSLAVTKLTEMMIGLGVLMDYVDDTFTAHIPIAERAKHSLNYRLNNTIQLLKGTAPPAPSPCGTIEPPST